jgi:hypothetical protein
MNPPTAQPGEGVDALGRPTDFSLVLGGPLYQLLRRAHLTDDALHMARRRVVVITLLAWLPLLLLSALEGRALGGSTAVPFLLDIDVHIRYLVALPLMVAAELVVHLRMRSIVDVFVERHLVPDAARPRFDAALASAFRLRNSVPAETALIAFVYGVGILVLWRQYVALDTSTWYATPTAAGSTLSLAGLWYGFFSLPLFQFLLVRWYFRLFIWARFLWQVARIELNLVPTHPDRLGGLGFLAATAHAFTLLAVAHGALLAGLLANRIFHLGERLLDFKAEIAVMVAFVVLIVVAPLLVFGPQLARAKRTGLREYGTFGMRYVREFDTKWLRGGAPAGEPLVGSADLSSLGNLGVGHEVVRTMRALPVTKDMVVQIAVATLAPVVPLALTMMPLEELLKRLLGMLL